MQYLGSEYKLSPVPEKVYVNRSKRYGLIKLRHDLESTLEIILRDEDPSLAKSVLGTGSYLMAVYGDGGGHFCNALGVSLDALRRTNPQPMPPMIGPDDWHQAAAREEGLRNRLGSTTLEAVSGIGLLEVRDVNPSFVDAYQETFDTPALSQYLGFTGLGALFAHDLAHFASQRG